LNVVPTETESENRVDGHTSERLLLVEENAELAYVASNSGSTSSERLERLDALRRRVVAARLIVDLWYLTFRPNEVDIVSQREYALRRPLEEPIRLTLLFRNEGYDVFAQPRGTVSLSTSVTNPCW